MHRGLEQLRDALRCSAERDWEQFYTPENLAIALSVEALKILCVQAHDFSLHAAVRLSESLGGARDRPEMAGLGPTRPSLNFLVSRRSL
jgi:hypothetical protein